MNSSTDIAIDMFQKPGGTRTIGSNVTFISKVTPYTNDPKQHTGFLFNSTTVYFIMFYNWSNPNDDGGSVRSTVTNMDISYCTSASLTRKIEWNFSYLPKSYDGVQVVTRAAGSVEKVLSLDVKPCKQQETVKAYDQNALITIESYSGVEFMDTATCSCPDDGQDLFNVDGTRFIGSATCADDAQWIGCSELQCWSGPSNIRAIQLNTTLSATKSFSCSYNDGFPASTNHVLTIDGLEISPSYALKSADNGRNLACIVVSKYIEKTQETYKSPPVPITVHYPPENSSLSRESLTIDVNESASFTYSVLANPSKGNIQVSTRKRSTSTSAGMFILTGKSATRFAKHTFEFRVSIKSYQDFGRFDVCAATTRPAGEDCKILTIRRPNPATPTAARPTDSASSHAATESSAEPEGLQPVVIALSVVGSAVVILVVGLAVWRAMRKKSSNEGSNRKERMNEVYGLVTNQPSSSSVRRESFQQDRADVLYEATNFGAEDVEEKQAQNAFAADLEEEEIESFAVFVPDSKYPRNLQAYEQVDFSPQEPGDQNVLYEATNFGAEDVEEKQAQNAFAADLEEEEIESFAVFVPDSKYPRNLQAYEQVDFSPQEPGDQNEENTKVSEKNENTDKQAPAVVHAVVDITKKPGDQNEEINAEVSEKNENTDKQAPAPVYAVVDITKKRKAKEKCHSPVQLDDDNAPKPLSQKTNPND